MKLRNATRAMSSESSDSPRRNQSPKVSFKTRSEKVRALSAVTRKLGGRMPDSKKEEEVRGGGSPFKANVEKVKLLSTVSRSFAKDQGSSSEEKSTNLKSSAKKGEMLPPATRMISAESTPSKERLVSFEESEEKSRGARPKTSKWRQKSFSPSSSPSRNLSRMSSLFGSEVEIPQERPKSSRRSRSEEKGRQESKKQMGSYTDIYQVPSFWKALFKISKIDLQFLSSAEERRQQLVGGPMPKEVRFVFFSHLSWKIYLVDF